MKPRKLNEAFIRSLIETLKKGYTFTDACEMLDVSQETVRSWRKHGKKESRGLCHQLHLELSALEKQRETEKLKRQKHILDTKIAALQKRYAPERAV